MQENCFYQEALLDLLAVGVMQGCPNLVLEGPACLMCVFYIPVRLMQATMHNANYTT